MCNILFRQCGLFGALVNLLVNTCLGHMNYATSIVMNITLSSSAADVVIEFSDISEYSGLGTWNN